MQDTLIAILIEIISQNIPVKKLFYKKEYTN